MRLNYCQSYLVTFRHPVVYFLVPYNNIVLKCSVCTFPRLMIFQFNPGHLSTLCGLKGRHMHLLPQNARSMYVVDLRICDIFVAYSQRTLSKQHPDKSKNGFSSIIFWYPSLHKQHTLFDEKMCEVISVLKY